MWILLDKKNICRCLATLPQNLHPAKIEAGMDIYELEDGPYLVGDEYSPNTGLWTPHPENYPQPTEEQEIEVKITARMDRNARDLAVEELKYEDEIPDDYEPAISIP